MQRILLFLPLLVVASVAEPQVVSVPNTFTNGTVADADEINANFDELETAANSLDTRFTAAQSAADAAAAGHTVNTNTQLSEAQVDAFVANNAYASVAQIELLVVFMEAFNDVLSERTKMFLSTDPCPVDYTAVEDGYIKLGSTGLSTTVSPRTLLSPGHGHSFSLDAGSTPAMPNWQQFNSLGQSQPFPRYNVALEGFTDGVGDHSHAVTGTVGNGPVSGDTAQNVSGDMEHITLRLCVRTS